MSLVDVERLREIAEVEFNDIVEQAYTPDDNELRVILTDGSFVDVWFSLKLVHIRPQATAVESSHIPWN